jgi:hypothetical protein
VVKGVSPVKADRKKSREGAKAAYDVIKTLRKNAEIGDYSLEGARRSRVVHRFQKTYDTAGKPCPFKTSTPQSRSETSSAMPQWLQYQARLEARLEAAPFQTSSAEKQ